MKQLLIGNDILISWAVFMRPAGSEVAEPYDLEGKDIKVLAYNALRKVEMDIAEIKGNVVKLRFYGKDQRFTGAYSLVLIENDGKEGMHTIDKCGAFQLVRQSCDMCSCGDAENIQITTLELESVVDAMIMAGSGVVDAELSLESENAVQNKVITAALNGKQEAIEDLDAIRQGAKKGATAVQEHQSLEGYATKKELESYVEKKDGYGLSQEDFTTTLKDKLSGWENYDDAELQASIEALGKRLDALVGTSASEAIDTFNEIVAFLNGVGDTSTLEGIIAEIGKQISAVEAKIPTDYVKPSELANVATSGSYRDLKDKPTIPNAVTEEDVSGWGFTKNKGTVQSVTINGESKTPNESGIVDLGEIKGGGEKTYKVITSNATTVYIEKDTINYWELPNNNDKRTVYINDNEASNGECELWVMVGNTKPEKITFAGVYWQGDKSPLFDPNKMYKMHFFWTAWGKNYGSWEEYPLVSNEGQTIPITVIDFNLKTAFGDTMFNANRWANRSTKCLRFLVGGVANDKGYTCPKADIIGLQEIWMEGTQWNDIQDWFNEDGVGDYASILANRGDTFYDDSEAVAILYRKDRFTRVSGGYFWLRGGGWNGDTGDFNKEGVSMWDKEAQQMENYEPYKRIAVWIILRDISTGKEFFVLNTHYDRYFYVDGKTPASTPYYSSELVKNRIDALSGGRPVIFMGDLHCNPDKSAIAILKPTYYKLHDARDRAAETFGMKYTMNSWAEESISPTYALFDYIFTTDDFEVNQFIVPYAKVDGTWISDHNPVIADLYLKI